MNNRHPDNMHRTLCAYAHRLTGGNQHLADKLLAATLTRLAERATAYPPTVISFTIWAKIVMKNTFHETTANADFHELHHLAYHGTLNPMLPARNKEYTIAQQIQTMSRLTPHQAAAATLRLNGYSHKEIAAQMGISVKHAKEHLAQARHIIATAWDN